MIVETQSLPERVRLGLRPVHFAQTGPYARMRHPIYVAEGCFWAGMMVLLGSPVVAAVFAGMAAGAVWIVRKEETALEEQFGDEYRAYRARVAALPGLRRTSGVV